MKTPDRTTFELILAKWLIFLMLFVALLFWLNGWNKCRTICKEKEYVDFQYSHEARGKQSTCHCFKMEELSIKKSGKTIEGTRVF